MASARQAFRSKPQPIKASGAGFPLLSLTLSSLYDHHRTKNIFYKNPAIQLWDFFCDLRNRGYKIIA